MNNTFTICDKASLHRSSTFRGRGWGIWNEKRRFQCPNCRWLGCHFTNVRTQKEIFVLEIPARVDMALTVPVVRVFPQHCETIVSQATSINTAVPVHTARPRSSQAWTASPLQDTATVTRQQSISRPFLYFDKRRGKKEGEKERENTQSQRQEEKSKGGKKDVRKTRERQMIR